MEAETLVDRVLDHYALQDRRKIESLGSAGGFSGARFWRIQSASSVLCLRRWPTEHPDEKRLAFIHHTLKTAAQQELTFLPEPYTARGGMTYVCCGGTLWELTPWLPGRADFHEAPRRSRLVDAVQGIARFHTVTADLLPGPERVGPPPGLLERRDFLTKLSRGHLSTIAEAARRATWPGLEPRIDRYLAMFSRVSHAVAGQLADASQISVRLQPAIRDLRHDHLLFSGDRLTGLVDFGALRRDYWAGDIARLLGSLVGDQVEMRQAALDAYHQTRPLAEIDRTMIEVYDRSNVLMSPANWFRWIGLEKRQFSPPDKILTIIDEWLQRLERMAE